MMAAVIDRSPELLEAQRVAAAGKRFQNLRAQLCLRGFELHILTGADGRAEYQVHRWSFAKTLPDLPAAEAFLARVAGAPA